MTSIIKVQDIQNATGDNIIKEASNTITIGASGDTTNIVGTLQNNGAGVGGANTPAFFAYLGSNQDISDDTWTKVSINTEEYDTAGNFDNSSNYRFTPTTAGKYFFYATVCLKSGSDNKIRSCGMAFYKNGSALYGGTNDVGNEQSTSEQTTISASFTMNGSSDYVELYGRIDVASGIGQFLSNYQSANRTTYFGAYKIIE